MTAATVRPEPWLQKLAAELCSSMALAKRAVAKLLGVAESTLRSWCRAAVKALTPRRGRPPRLADRLQRNDILAVIHAANGRVSVRELKATYPNVGRAQLTELLKRYRRVRRKAVRRGHAALQWSLPGAVWAMDHTDLAVSGLGRHVLVVRDLASGKSLAATPCSSPDAGSATAILTRLFREHGAPLVLKADNGSAFVADQMKQALRAAAVLPLYSPPGTPAYNGACEAGVGSLKHRALEAAWSRGETSPVTADDLALARAQADAERIERRSGAPTRAAAWRSRSPLSRELRSSLLDHVDRWRQRLCQERGIASYSELPHAEQARVDRFAIGRALRFLNLLNVTRRR